MNRYQPLEFRPALGAAALAMAALTMALAVGVPARMAPAPSSPLAGADAASVATGVMFELPRIEVVGVRETDVAASAARAGHSRG